MAMLAGKWTEEPTITGDRLLLLNGQQLHIPEKSTVKLVHTGLHGDIAHVKVGVRVFVFSRYGQLVESDLASKARAGSTAWYSIAAST
jgi:hypothetical protein